MKGNKVLPLLGLAKKAGKIASGEFSTEAAVKSGKAHLVLVSEEASENTKKKFHNMCAHYEVPICFYGKKEELGKCIGQEFRASLAVTDPGFAENVKKQLERECEEPEGTPGNMDERRVKVWEN